jgi:Fe-S-cluster-containing hydrogenase component 2
MFWIFLILFLLPDYLRAAKYFYLLPILFFIGILELLYPYTLYGSKIRIINLALTLAPAPLISLMYLFGQKSSKKTPSKPNPTKVALILCRRGEGELELLGDFPKGLSCSMMEASFPKGPYACPYACLGALDCVSSCQNSAIILSNNMPEVSPERCIGCGECISHCPRGLIRLIPKDAYVAIRCSGVHKMKLMDKLCLKGCLGCGLCRKACPLNAVEKPSAKAPPIINYHLCQGVPNCNMECKESCPRKLPDSVFPL